MPFECRSNDNSFMLTAIGRKIQTLESGWYGAGPDLIAFPGLALSCWDGYLSVFLIGNKKEAYRRFAGVLLSLL